jgi:hypothetical protein
MVQDIGGLQIFTQMKRLNLSTIVTRRPGMGGDMQIDGE